MFKKFLLLSLLLSCKIWCMDEIIRKIRYSAICKCPIELCGSRLAGSDELIEHAFRWHQRLMSGTTFDEIFRMHSKYEHIKKLREQVLDERGGPTEIKYSSKVRLKRKRPSEPKSAMATLSPRPLDDAELTLIWRDQPL